MKRETLDRKRTKLSVIARKAAGDEAFRNQFVADPAGVLQTLGVDLPEGVKVLVHQDTDEVFNMVLPAKMLRGAAQANGAALNADASDPQETGEPTAPVGQDPSGGNSTGIISEGELFDEFIDGNVSNSMIFPSYTNSGNLTFVYNITINNGPAAAPPTNGDSGTGGGEGAPEPATPVSATAKSASASRSSKRKVPSDQA